METEILTSLANKGAIGVIILAVAALVYIVRMFLKHIESEAKLSRDSQAIEAELSRISHKETAQMSKDALEKVSEVVVEFQKTNQDAHNKIINGIAEVKAKV